MGQTQQRVLAWRVVRTKGSERAEARTLCIEELQALVAPVNSLCSGCHPGYAARILAPPVFKQEWTS